MICNYSVEDLFQNDELFKALLEGQKFALSKYGLEDAILTQADLFAGPETFAVIARSIFTGEMVGGIRIYIRTDMRPLPLESEGSYLPSEYRNIILREPSVCEVRGLWVSPHFAGHEIGFKISELAISHCYELGYSAVVGTGQMRTFKYLGEPLGFKREMSIPPIPYPDARFETIVGWHRKNPDETLFQENPIGYNNL